MSDKKLDSDLPISDKIIRDLLAYANRKVKNYCFADCNGEDFVQEAIEKVLSGKRKWNEEVDFYHFLVWVVNGLIFHHAHGFDHVNKSEIDPRFILDNKGDGNNFPADYITYIKEIFQGCPTDCPVPKLVKEGEIETNIIRTVLKLSDDKAKNVVAKLRDLLGGRGPVNRGWRCPLGRLCTWAGPDKDPKMRSPL